MKPPTAWWQHALGDDVIVWVRDGASPWRTKQLRAALEEFAAESSRKRSRRGRNQKSRERCRAPIEPSRSSVYGQGRISLGRTPDEELDGTIAEIRAIIASWRCGCGASAGRGDDCEAVVPVLYKGFEGLKSRLTERGAQGLNVLHNHVIAARFQLGQAFVHPIFLLLA